MSKYKYYGCDLTPDIFAELLTMIFLGKLFGREECIDGVKMYHEEHGGICERNSYIDTFKRATLTLREKGYPISNVAYGKWRIEDNCEIYQSFRSKLTKGECIDSQEISGNVQKEIGDGNETVYVYYYPVYKRYALLQGKDSWCCKVGMTTKKLWDRIFSQAGTCFPEEPFVELIIKCDDAHKLEQTFHNILKMKGKWIENAPGKEWFITSPDEILSIYESVIKM